MSDRCSGGKTDPQRGDEPRCDEKPDPVPTT
jgi:hypothetical protein